MAFFYPINTKQPDSAARPKNQRPARIVQAMAVLALILTATMYFILKCTSIVPKKGYQAIRKYNQDF